MGLPRVVFGWGANSYGELGLGPEDPFGDRFCPTPLLDSLEFNEESASITALAAGFDFSLAIVGGRVYAWGNNTFGQLGNGTNEQANYTYPILADGIDKEVVAIAAGGYHSVALDVEGGVWTWGRNDNGQLGIGSDQLFVASPTLVSDWSGGGGGGSGSGSGSGGSSSSTSAFSSAPVITQIAAGLFHTMTSDGANIYSWGSNEFGQLGNKDYPDMSDVPVLVDFSGASYKIDQLAAGSFHSLALVMTLNNSDSWRPGVLSWGRDDVGQLGLGNDTLMVPTPQLSNFFTDGAPIPLAVAAGYCHSMVIGQQAGSSELQ